MPGLVISCDLPVFFGNHSALLLRSHSNFVDAFLNVCHRDFWSSRSCRQDCSFIEHVFNICTSKANCYFCKNFEINIVIKRLVASMNFQNSFSATNIWNIDVHLSVKPARSQKCWIKNIRTVGCCQNDYPFIWLKTIHFNKKLIESLLSFIISATKTGTTLATNSINFINKNNARFIFLGLVKKISHS